MNWAVVWRKSEPEENRSRGPVRVYLFGAKWKSESWSEENQSRDLKKIEAVVLFVFTFSGLSGNRSRGLKKIKAVVWRKSKSWSRSCLPFQG